jgi:hypothetical protein
MLFVFAREGDFRLAGTAGLVLAIIFAGIVLGEGGCSSAITIK